MGNSGFKYGSTRSSVFFCIVNVVFICWCSKMFAAFSSSFWVLVHEDLACFPFSSSCTHRSTSCWPTVRQQATRVWLPSVQWLMWIISSKASCDRGLGTLKRHKPILRPKPLKPKPRELLRSFKESFGTILISFTLHVIMMLLISNM